ncbi:MazG-like family protein [Streptomyces kronopolitis]|uniref:MazG-like family protein n=1 Tax=Streptomyces kronopolitis TaxID=1612435 RepID=UPI003D977173
MEETWKTVERLREWLDAESPLAPDATRIMRVLKITEEAGEVAEAMHGMLGSNPRKGKSHTEEDVRKELCDVILTSMVALASFTPDAAGVFDERLRHIADRSLG